LERKKQRKREREKDKKRDRKREREKERKKECISVTSLLTVNPNFPEPRTLRAKAVALCLATFGSLDKSRGVLGRDTSLLAPVFLQDYKWLGMTTILGILYYSNNSNAVVTSGIEYKVLTLPIFYTI